MCHGGRALWLSSWFVFFSFCVYGQQYQAGVIRVKIKEPVAARMAITGARGASFGVAAIDQLNKRSGVLAVRRVFPEAGKFEHAHRAFGLHLWYELEFPEATSLSAMVSSYAQLDEFDIVEPSRPYQRVAPEETAAVKGGRLSISGAVSDPYFDKQWHYENNGSSGGTAGADIRLRKAWEIHTGDPRVIVAVIDGGIDVKHPDLSASMWINKKEIPGNAIDDDNNGYVDDVYGYGFGDRTGTIHPDYHGTHVAGTIAAVSNNKVGVAGIAGGSGDGQGVRLMSCATFGKNGVGGFEAAMVYAADNGAVIAQNSWTGGSRAIEAAIDYFVSRAGFDNTAENFDKNIQVGPVAGGVVIFAAGNNNSSVPEIGYPASYSKVIAVASTDHNDKRSSFSNYGTWVDIAAPGTDVYSTYPVQLGSYAYLSGTSMACPHVSGVAALVISYFGGPSYTAGHVWEQLIFTADNINNHNPAYKNMLGSGRLNALKALQKLTDLVPAAVKDLAAKEIKSHRVVLTWTATGAKGFIGTASEYDLRYSTSPLTAANFKNAASVPVPKPGPSGQKEQLEITGLLPNTPYYFALQVKDSLGGVSSLSNVAHVKTLAPPKLVLITPSVTDQLPTGGRASHYVTINNTGAGELELSAYAEEPWLLPDTGKITVKAGASHRLTVGIHASGLPGGLFHGGVVLTSNDPQQHTIRIPVSLTVTSAPELLLETTNLNFGACVVTEVYEKELVIKNRGFEVLIIDSLVSTNELFAIEQKPFSLDPGSKKALRISCQLPHRGQHSGVIRIISNSAGSNTVVVTAHGVIPQLSLVHARLDFGKVYAQAAYQQELVLQNTGDGILNIDSITISHAAFSVREKRFSIEPGKRKSIPVSIRCDVEGDVAAVLYITSNDILKPLQKVQLLADVATAPVLTIEPGAVEMTITRGIEKSFDLRIRNTGGDELVWRISNMLPYWLSLGTVPNGVSANHTEEIKLQIDARNLVVGQYSGVLQFIYNTPFDSVVTVPLRVTVAQNAAPQLVQLLPDRVMAMDSEGEELRLTDYFADEDVESLRFIAESSNTTLIARVNGNVLHLVPVNVGHCIVAVTAQDRLGEYKQAFFKVTVSPVLEATKGITVTNFQCYPNPVEQFAHITYDVRTKTKVQVVLHDGAGRPVAIIHDDVAQAGKHEVVFAAETLKPGIYIILVMENGKPAESMKLVKL